MSAKAKQLIIIYTVSALAVLSVLSAVLYARLSDYRLAASYGSAQAFETTVSAVDGMSLALKKSLYATDEVLGRSLCSQVYAKALAAEASMSSLPFSTQELEQLSAFLNKAGDYARSLCAQGDNELSEQQRRQLRSMSDTAADFSARLRELQGRINSGELIMDTREQQLQNIGLDDTGTLSSELLGYEAGIALPEDFEYDGQYNAKPEKAQGTLSAAQARALAAEAVGVEERELKDEYSYEGSDGRRCYSAGGTLLCVSSRGLESMAQSRLISACRIEADKAKELAESFLKERGYEGLSLSTESSSGGLASFRYVPVQDGALRLDDYISISIALDDGSVYAYDCTNYTAEEVELNWSADENAARNVLPAELSADSCRKVVVKSPGGKYQACYELSCSGENGERVTVYVDAATGRQCRIEL